MQQVVLTLNNGKDTEELYQLLELQYGEDNIHAASAQGFDGVNEINYLLSLGGGAAFIQLGQIIKKWLEGKSNRTVKIDNIEIKGYSINEIEKIIEKIKKPDDGKE